MAGIMQINRIYHSVVQIFTSPQRMSLPAFELAVRKVAWAHIFPIDILLKLLINALTLATRLKPL
jgi:hypothetical protein